MNDKEGGKRGSTWRTVAIISGVLIVVAFLYGTSYLCLMEPVDVLSLESLFFREEIRLKRLPRYPHPDLPIFFEFAHWIDKQIRPDYWRPYRPQ